MTLLDQLDAMHWPRKNIDGLRPFFAKVKGEDPEAFAWAAALYRAEHSTDVPNPYPFAETEKRNRWDDAYERAKLYACGKLPDDELMPYERECWLKGASILRPSALRQPDGDQA